MYCIFSYDILYYYNLYITVIILKYVIIINIRIIYVF